ncbi:MAG: Alpha/beta hydrolase family protein [Promethearchaeota archaeon]|nr:MAG: Alpha/beta hydrolase family protein [Candidatus Lokiarchaeota archaeon]
MDIDDERVSNAVFYPRKTIIPKNLPEYLKILKFQIHNEVTIGGVLYLNEKSLPTILMFHGNGEVALDYRAAYSTYFEHGLNLAVMDFRGYGFSSHDPTYTSLIEDALPIYTNFCDYMEEIDMTGSLFVKGRSLGSVCASEIGSHNPNNVKGIIFESGFASAYNMMTKLFGIRDPSLSPESIQHYSNDTRVSQFIKPTLIIHGTNDWIIPSSEANLLYDALPENTYKKLVLIKGASHNDIFLYTSQYFDAIDEFVTRFK